MAENEKTAPQNVQAIPDGRYEQRARAVHGWCATYISAPSPAPRQRPQPLTHRPSASGRCLGHLSTQGSDLLGAPGTPDRHTWSGPGPVICISTRAEAVAGHRTRPLQGPALAPRLDRTVRRHAEASPERARRSQHVCSVRKHTESSGGAISAVL